MPATPSAPSDWLVSAFQDPTEFGTRALPFLLRRQAENCVPIGLLGSFYVLRGGAYIATVERASGSAGHADAEPPAIAGVAMMTPPHNLIVTAGTDPACLPAILEHVLAEGFSPPGVIGPSGLAAAFAHLWAERRGGSARRVMGQRVYELRSVRPVHGVAGRLRDATPVDRPLLVRWTAEFHAEALGESDHSRIEDSVDAAFVPSPEGRRLFLWEVDGAPVSMAGVAGRTPRGIRVGVVYTPPALRRRGYASACVAAVSQAQLDAGLEACFLFTDLANPTSNAIYQAIGYEPVADSEVYAFSTTG